MIQVVRGPLEICRGWGQRCRLSCGERSVFHSSPSPPWNPPPNAVPGPQKRPRTAISTFLSPSLPPRALAGFGGVGQVNNSPQFKKSTGRKGRAIPKVVGGAKVSVQVAAVKVGAACVEQKNPQWRHGLGAFMTRPCGLAGLNVEKDQHEKLWQTLTSERVADDKHCCFVGGASPWTTSPHIHAAQDQSGCDDEE
jgi:hypothetical protein